MTAGGLILYPGLVSDLFRNAYELGREKHRVIPKCGHWNFSAYNIICNVEVW